MNRVQEVSVDILNHKEIYLNMPQSDLVEYRVFSRLLDDDKVVASYKMYWLLGILDEVALGNTEIEFKKIISRMIVYSWYPLLQYKLNYGIFDNLKKSVNYIATKYNLPNNYDENKLLDFIYSNDDKELNKMMKELTYNVPYRLLSPFFIDKLKGQKDSVKNKMITELSLESENCLYKIVKCEKDKIILNQGWKDYLQKNYKVIKGWIYYKIVCFLQKRNPNVPAIAFKIEAPKSRNLTRATTLWKEIIASKNINDIYTNMDFTEENYNRLGGLSIDHFIPWSFVLHDEMWNLTPTFKNINSSKSDNLPSYQEYIDKFCSVQYEAFSYLCDKKKEKDLECYIDVMRLENPFEFLKYKSREEFNDKLKQTISPIYQIALNQGFEVLNKVYK